ncbi:hypothetical protein ACXYTP_00015 [Tsukamurella ocularis]|uniref:hypothetical protein n=1 Tax=Tsukamurella ocularis TaxID=1970234 RepID=UPI0039F03858
MSAVESRLAATLAKHQWRVFHSICACGDPTVAYDDHPAHVAAVIASADDLAVVSLPKPDSGGEAWSQWGTSHGKVLAFTGEDDVRSTTGSTQRTTPLVWPPRSWPPRGLRRR